jgi:hypothetical protein
MCLTLRVYQELTGLIPGHCYIVFIAAGGLASCREAAE